MKWCPVPCPPGGSGGLGPPGISVNYPCLASAAAVPCPRALPPIFFRPNFFRRNFFVGIFSSEFFRPNFFRPIFSSVVGPSSVRPSSVRPGILSWVYFSSAVIPVEIRQDTYRSQFCIRQGEWVSLSQYATCGP